MKIMVLIALMFSVGSSFAQSTKEKYADQLYSKNEFYEAGQVYQELAEKAVKKGEANYQYSKRAAECLISNREYSKAIQQYETIPLTELNVEDSKKYLNCLLVLKEYNKAERFIESKPELKKSYPRGETTFPGITKLLKDSLQYSIESNTINSGLGDFGITVHNNEAWFASGRKPVGLMIEEYPWDNSNYLKIYAAGVNGRTISEPKIIPSLATKYHDGPIAISPDGMKMLVTRNVVDKSLSSKTLKLVEYKKESDGSWKEVGDFSHNVTGKNVGHAFFLDNGKIYFISEQDGGFGGSDIYYSELSETGNWSTPMNMGKGVNTSEDEFFPSFDDQGNFYFSSNGFVGLGGFDVYKIEKNGLKAVNMGYPLNSSADDFAYFPISESFGFLSSDRGDHKDRIYNVTISPVKGKLHLTILDQATKKTLEDVALVMVDESGNETPVVKEKGSWSAEILPGHKYEIKASKEDYQMVQTISFNTEELKRNEVMDIQGEMFREKSTVSLRTVDKATKQPIGNVSGYFTDSNNNKIPFVSDSLGVAKVKIPANQNYELRASKKGYVDYSDEIVVKSETEIELDLALTELKKDVTFEIKNILYDFNKYNLRDESMVELDKLVEFLKVNDNITVELSSHTDSRGNNNSNQVLSQNRAQSCVDYLISKGIPKSRIVAKGYGETKLINACSNGVECSEEEHQANRRTEIRILKI